MPNRKLLETIAFFSNKEVKKLRYFVESPYHNTKYNRSKIVLLLENVLATKGLDKNEDLGKKKLNSELFPQAVFRSKGKNPIDSLASDLLSLIQRFITIQSIQKNLSKGQEYLAVARFYRNNNMENRFWQTVKQFRTYQKNTSIHDAKYFLELFQMEEEIATFQSIFNTYTVDPNLIAVNVSLDNFYVISKLEYTAALQYQKLLGQINTEEALYFGDFILEAFPKYEFIRSPIAQLNYQIIQLFNAPQKQKAALLDEFLQTAESFENVIPWDKYRNLMAFYRYFIGKQYQLETKGRELLDRILLVYKEHLAKGYFHTHEEKKLLPISLKLMVNIALKVGDVIWAKQLLKDYPPSKITGTHYQEEAHSLCQGEVLFYEQKYIKAQDHLVYKNFENINYSILADVLLVKIYFMLDNELLKSRVSALSQKIRRSKLAPESKEKYMNFIKVIKQIAKYKWNESSKKKERIEENVQQLTPLIEREWLMSIL